MQIHDFISHDPAAQGISLHRAHKLIELNEIYTQFNSVSLGMLLSCTQDAKDTVNELNLKNNSQQMELNSRGHSKKGNSLFAEVKAVLTCLL